MEQTLTRNPQPRRERRWGRLYLRREQIAFGTVFVVTALVGGLVASAVAAPAVAGSGDLVRLLHFMALLKGLLVMGAVAVVWRRLRRETEARLLLGYVLGPALALIGVMWLYAQWHPGWGALLFYGGVLILTTTLLRDRHLLAPRETPGTMRDE